MAESYNPMRYGVFGINPRGTSMIDEYIKAREGLGKIGEQGEKNRMMAIENQYLPAKQQSGIQETLARSGLYGAQGKEALGRIPLMNAQTAETYGRIPLMNAQAKEAMARTGLYGTQADREKMMMGLTSSMGTSGFIPDGMGGWVKDPRMGSYRSGAGGTYIDPQTGQVISTDTTTQAARDQRSIAGIKNVTSYLDEAMKTLPQFQTADAKGKVALQRIGNLFGGDFRGPSELASGEAAILESAEGFINAFGLNATNENVAKAAKIMAPGLGESGPGYKERVAKQLTAFAKQQQRSGERLAEGTDVTPPGNAGNSDPLGLR